MKEILIAQHIREENYFMGQIKQRTLDLKAHVKHLWHRNYTHAFRETLISYLRFLGAIRGFMTVDNNSIWNMISFYKNN